MMLTHLQSNLEISFQRFHVFMRSIGAAMRGFNFKNLQSKPCTSLEIKFSEEEYTSLTRFRMDSIRFQYGYSPEVGYNELDGYI